MSVSQCIGLQGVAARKLFSCKADAGGRDLIGAVACVAYICMALFDFDNGYY